MPRFRLFNIPVTVHPSFLLIALALGWFSNITDWSLMVVWVGIVFVSVLVHEFGHALTAKGFGAQAEVELNGMGGLTRWAVPDAQLPPGRRAVVAAAGSIAGFALGGVAWLVSTNFGPFDSTLVNTGLRLLTFVNVFWGVLNWLPIRLLDGGHLMMSLLAKLAPKRAERVGRVVFTITSGLVLLAALQYDLFFLAILAGWMLLSELGLGQRRTAGQEMPTLTYDAPDDEEAPGKDTPPALPPEMDWYRPDDD